MVGWAFLFLITAIIAAPIGFAGIAGAGVAITAKVVCLASIALFVLTLVAAVKRRNRNGIRV